MNWHDILAPAMEHPKIVEIKKFIKSEKEKGKKIYPEGKDIFRAFNLTSFNQTRVVILGQDPYHTPGTADGLCFSSRGAKRPPSLQVIFKEIYKDFNIQYFHEKSFDDFFPTNSLENWARNGFLLLNTVLTVEEGNPGSHKDLGWEVLINAVFEALNNREESVVFLLWGNHAQQYKERISSHHLTLRAPHPAAELHNGQKEAIFSGCGHFSAVRDILPTLKGMDLFELVRLDHYFDKDKAKEFIAQTYPNDKHEMFRFIDNDLMISVPVNRKKYWEYIRQFEESLSTKPI